MFITIWCLRKSTIFAVLVAALVVLSSMSSSQAANEGPPPGYKLQGPAALGTATFTINGANANESDLTFSGTCKGQPISVSTTNLPAPLSSITQTFLDGFVIQAPPQFAACHSVTNGERLIVQLVQKYASGPTAVTADVILMFLVP